MTHELGKRIKVTYILKRLGNADVYICIGAEFLVPVMTQDAYATLYADLPPSERHLVMPFMRVVPRAGPTMSATLAPAGTFGSAMRVI